MVSDPCDDPIGIPSDPCNAAVAALVAKVALHTAAIASLESRVCKIESQAISRIEILANGSLRETRFNGSFEDVPSPYLDLLLQQVTAALNDTNKIVSGELASNGVLTLIRADNTVITLGNVTDIVNPARAIEIRNDGRIEITLKDGTTQFSSTRTIQDQVGSGSGGGGGGGTTSILSLFDDPKVWATATTYNQSGSVDISALPGVTVTLGSTHVLVRVSLQHHYLNPGDPESPNFSTARVESKDVCTAGRKNVNGSEGSIGGYSIGDTNSAIQTIPLPGDNVLDWAVVSSFAGSSTPAAANRVKVHCVFEVLGFIQSTAQ